ncbi:MAG: IS4 family transposase, partial [Treponema sp.]|nr:IS4 family transposase [Treponema sp.]
MFETTLEKAQQNSTSHGFRFKNPLYSIDATTIDLCLKLFSRADFRKNKGGIKLTVKLDHQGKIPCFVAESTAREHDCKKIRSVPF